MDIWVALVVLFAIMLIVMFSGTPIFASLGFAGVIGFLLFLAPNQLQHIGVIIYEQGTHYNQIILPMFVMMSEFLSRGGIAEDIYTVLNRGIGKFRGGLAIATTLACTIFAALCGSSPATAASIGKISIQEMTKRGYAPSFAVGTVAASGTLGIMIPPSITLCLFGILTQTSIVRLLMAGIIPGLITAAFIITFILIRVRINPKLTNCSAEPNGPAKSAGEMNLAEAREILSEAKNIVAEEKAQKQVEDCLAEPVVEKDVKFLAIVPALVLIFVVLGSMYFGFATPMEAAGYGVVGAFVILIAKHRMTLKMFSGVMSGTARTGTMMVFMILCGFILTYVVSYLGIPIAITNAITQSGLNRYVVLLMLYVLWFILGCLMDPTSVVLLTVPFMFEPLVALGFNEIWIGVMTVIASQIGMITPPIGMNLFVLKANTDVQMKDIIKGCWPYVVLLVFALFFFTLFPDLATILPNAMFAPG